MISTLEKCNIFINKRIFRLLVFIVPKSMLPIHALIEEFHKNTFQFLVTRKDKPVFGKTTNKINMSM